MYSGMYPSILFHLPDAGIFLLQDVYKRQARFIDQVKELEIEYKLHTMVMDISPDKVVTAMNRAAYSGPVSSSLNV